MSAIPPSQGTTYCGMYGPISLAAGSPLSALSSTTVTVYESDGSTVATIYAGGASGSGLSNRGPARGTPLSGGQLTTDAYGTVQFFADPGLYVLSFLVGGTTTTRIVEVHPDYTDSAWNVVLDTSGGTLTPLSGDSRDCDCTTASTTYSSISAALGTRYRFQRKDATTNTLTIDAPGGGNILGPGLGSGVSAITLAMQGASVEFQGDGTNLRVVKWGPEAYSGAIGSNVSLGVNTLTKIMDTASLGVGMWLVTMTTTILVGGSAGGIFSLVGALDTAVGSISGPTVAEGTAQAVTNQEVPLSTSFVVTITTAGTLKMSGYGTTGSGCNALATTENGFSSPTGYTAVRLGS